MPSIDELHTELFGYVPSKDGTAYERIGAVVLATLGWRDVVHDTRERPPSQRANHQLDIVARDPSGTVSRLIVECKDWDQKVGQGTLNALVGVRAQTGADAAAVITTEGFTKGALDVAVDADIALVRLDAYDPERHGTNFVRSVVLTVNNYFPVHSDFDIEIVDTDGSREALEVKVTGADHLLHGDGSRAERILDVLQANASPMEEGVFRQRAALPPGRFIPTVDGPAVEIQALMWTETNHLDTFEVVHEAKGDPVLFLKQLDETGEGGAARLLISQDLFAWDVDAQGNVVPRGNLAPDAEGGV